MWIVNIKGKPNTNSVEISVVKDNFEHGKKSHGWFDKDKKRVVFGSGGPCRYYCDQFLFDKMVKVAEDYCDFLNADTNYRQGMY